MKKGDILSGGDHVSRYVRFGQINPSDGMPNGAAFERRQNERDGPSFNWIEYFGLESIEKTMNAIRDLFETSKPFTVGAQAVFAVL